MRVESVPSANAHAKVVTSSILGNEITNRELPWFWSDQYELKLQMAGLSEGYDEIHIHGKIEENAFMACYGKEGSLIAVDSVNMPKNFNNYKKALANSMRLSMDLIKDPNFDPSSIFSASY
jgi:3-phenylpropionate/trans-cinnamate dioxygenase ferredoxin reductase subunit